jgi:hypothetical protein
LPLSVLAGFAAAAVMAGWWLLGRPRLADWWRNGPIIVVAIAALLPVVFFVITVPPVYTGIRHFLFVVPPIMVLAALGYDRLIDLVARQDWRPKAAFAAAAAIVATVQAGEMVILHPYEYVSYNALVGGLKGARGKWSTDYWGNTVPEAVEELSAQVEKEFRNGAIPRQRYLVGACVEPISIKAHLPPYFEFTRDWQAAHFFISPTHIGCDRVVRGQVIAEIKRLDTVLAVVKDRRGLVPASSLAERPRAVVQEPVITVLFDP